MLSAQAVYTAIGFGPSAAGADATRLTRIPRTTRATLRRFFKGDSFQNGGPQRPAHARTLYDKAPFLDRPGLHCRSVPNPSRLLGLAAALALPLAPLPAVPPVDLSRFMGDWYVIANIPTPIERDAFNAFESYARNADGTIAATFRFRKGGFDGTEKTYRPKGFVEPDGSNAVWGMRF